MLDDASGSDTDAQHNCNPMLDLRSHSEAKQGSVSLPCTDIAALVNKIPKQWWRGASFRVRTERTHLFCWDTLIHAIQECQYYQGPRCCHNIVTELRRALRNAPQSHCKLAAVR